MCSLKSWTKIYHDVFLDVYIYFFIRNVQRNIIIWSQISIGIFIFVSNNAKFLKAAWYFFKGISNLF